MKSIFFKWVLASGMLLSLSGCLKGNEEERRCDYDACATKAPAAEVQAVKDYLSTNNITATEHCSGLFYRVESAGTGKAADACSYVFARYKGMLTNGNVFDEATNPIDFSLTQVIRGWTNGVPLIKEGGRIFLYIPASLGYGSREVRNPQTGDVVIPANSTLIFEVNLVAVQ